ncbi:hypothetical protein GCM10010517_50510 [Streptosporangium fragile]|uniref:Uncharacterized protein n=1 Tax=Streptosporangium fragile TaxID=46186 RepID=A0ABP6IJ10_9ACTN
MGPEAASAGELRVAGSFAGDLRMMVTGARTHGMGSLADELVRTMAQEEKV